MSTSLTTTPPAGRGPWRRVTDFWFAAADPTTLGFMRVVTGLLVLYVHLAYAFDLRSFFGPDGWYNLSNINRERREAPYRLPDFRWDEVPPGAGVPWTHRPKLEDRSTALPEFPHRRQAVMAYLRDLIQKYPTQAQLNPALAYLDRLQRTDHLVARDGLEYLLRLSADPTFRRNQLAAVVDDKAQVNDPTPAPWFVNGLPPDERKKVVDEIERFFQTLPQDAGGEARQYVVHYLAGVDIQSRAGLLAFLRELTTLDAAERERRLDYLEYWGYEAKYADRTGSPIFSVWFHVTEPGEMAAAHAVALVVFLLFTLGVWTRVTSVLAWLAAVSYIHRTQQVLFGMDTMMNILLFYLMIGNSGAALSVDRLVNRYRAVRASLRRSGALDAATLAYLRQPPPSVSAGFALRLIQVHFCFIYMAAGLSKLKGAAWWNTNAYWDTLVNPEFTMIHYHWYEALVRQMASNRLLYSVAAALGVGFTFVCEIGVPFLVWTRLRPVAVVLGLLLHAGVAVFMGLWIFSLMMMTLLLAYLPGVAIRSRIFGDTAAGDRLTLRYSPGSEEQVRSAALAKAFDFGDRVDLVKTDVPAMQLEAKGVKASGESAAAELRSRLGGAGPVGLLMQVFGFAVRRMG